MEGIIGPTSLAALAIFVITWATFRILKYLNRPAINATHDEYHVRGFAKVIDGDSVVIQGIEIRLSGIDAPETQQWGKTRNGKWYRPGEVATKALRNRLKGRVALCTIEGTCLYGRALGTLFLEDGTDVNAWMVREGHAFAYRYYGRQYELSGIDAPETQQWGKTRNGKWYRPGEVATKALRNRLKGRISLCTIEGTCLYGRALGTLFLEDGTDVNAWMVREGHAFAYRYYGRQYERDEWIAKRKGINIHSGEVMEPWEWRRRRRYAEAEGWVPTRQ